MTYNKSFNQELFWLEQGSESDTETFIPSDTPLHSPHYVKLKKKSIKFRAQYMHNRTIQKQINEFKTLQKDFGGFIDINLLPKDRREGPVFELISGSKFIERNADEIKSLLEYIKNNEDAKDCDQKSDDNINEKKTTTKNENIKKDGQTTSYQNEILCLYNNLIDTYRLGHCNQLSTIQEGFNNQLLQVDEDSEPPNEPQTQDQVAQIPHKRVRFTDSTRDPRLKRVMQHPPSQPQPQPQPQKINEHIFSMNKEFLNTTNTTNTNNTNNSNHILYQPDISHGDSSIKNNSRSSSNFDNINKTSSSITTSTAQIQSSTSTSTSSTQRQSSPKTTSKQAQSSPKTTSIQAQSSPSKTTSKQAQSSPSKTTSKQTQSSSKTTSSNQLQSSPSTSISEPNLINPNTIPVQQFSGYLKVIRGKYLSSTGDFKIESGMLIWISNKKKQSINLGPINDYFDILDLYNRSNPDKTRVHRITLKALSRNGSAISCNTENGVPLFIYLPSLNKNTWLKIGTAEAVIGPFKRYQNTKK
ncbi:unnamed protein product [Cunninghamella blakesleeana]